MSLEIFTLQKHKRVQLVSEGSGFFSDVFRKSVNGRNIVQQSRKVKTLSFFCEKEFCFNFGETIFIFCEKDFCTIWILWTGFVTGEASFWYNSQFFLACLFISTMFQIAYEIVIEAYKPMNKILLCWVLSLPGIALRKVLVICQCNIVYIRCSCTASNHSHLFVSRSCPLKPYKDEKQILHEIQANEIITHIVKEGFCFTHEQHPM